MSSIHLGLLSLVCKSSLYYFRLFFNLIKNHVLLWSSNVDLVRECIHSNCRYIYKQRLMGKTNSNKMSYYLCMWKCHLLKIIPIRHTLILDLDETLIYSSRFTDLGGLSSSLESIGITIVSINTCCHIVTKREIC